MATRPQWPKVVALLGFMILGTAIGFNCAGGPALLDAGSYGRLIVGALFGALVGLALFGLVLGANPRRHDR